MKQIQQRKQHLAGDTSSDVLGILQTPSFENLNGHLTVAGITCRISDGCFVGGAFEAILVRLMVQPEASWSFRKVPGRPNGNLRVPFCEAIFSAMNLAATCGEAA